MVAVEAPEQRRRRDLLEVPGADGVAHRDQDGVLADARRAAEQQRMVDLLAGLLHRVRAVELDVLGVAGGGKTLRRCWRHGSAGAGSPGSWSGAR